MFFNERASYDSKMDMWEISHGYVKIGHVGLLKIEFLPFVICSLILLIALFLRRHWNLDKHPHRITDIVEESLSVPVRLQNTATVLHLVTQRSWLDHTNDLLRNPCFFLFFYLIKRVALIPRLDVEAAARWVKNNLRAAYVFMCPL